jgi:hypothetical protein
MKFENTFVDKRMADMVIENILKHIGAEGGIGEALFYVLFTSFELVQRSKQHIQGDKTKITKFLSADVVPILLGTYTASNSQKAVIAIIPSTWNEATGQSAIRSTLIEEFDLDESDFSPYWCSQGHAKVKTLAGPEVICNIYTTYLVCDEDRDVIMSLDRVTA